MSYVLGNIVTASVVVVSLTPAQTDDVTSVEQTFTVNGLRVGDVISGISSVAAQTAGIVVASARVVAANTLGITFSNPTAGDLTAVAGNYQFIVSRPDSVKSDGNI
jgi:hypothetical protein